MTSAASTLAPALARRAILPLTMLLAVTAAACGGDDGEPVAADGEDPTTTAELPPDDGAGSDPGDRPDAGDGGAASPVVEDDEGYEPTRPMLDMTDPKPHPIDEVVVADDGATIGVRYEAATEPCSGAVAEVTETDDSVTVELTTGLNPDAATMSCIAQVVRYELAVSLDAPLGDRELRIGAESAAAGSDSTGSDSTGSDSTGSGEDEGAAPRPPGTDSAPADDDGAGSGRDDEQPPADPGLSPAGSFIGLSLEEASRKADGEGRPWRIGRQDDELFALTADYNPDRLTFDIDDGIVTEAVTG